MQEEEEEQSQPKMQIGRPGDRFELEADSAAARVQSKQPVPSISRVPSSGLGGGESTGRSGEAPTFEVARNPTSELWHQCHPVSQKKVATGYDEHDIPS